MSKVAEEKLLRFASDRNTLDTGTDVRNRCTKLWEVLGRCTHSRQPVRLRRIVNVIARVIGRDWLETRSKYQRKPLKQETSLVSLEETFVFSESGTYHASLLQKEIFFFIIIIIIEANFQFVGESQTKERPCLSTWLSNYAMNLRTTSIFPIKRATINRLRIFTHL